MKWKLLSSEYLMQNRWAKIRKDRCETSAGKIVDPYFVYEFPTWVAGLPITKEGKVLLIRQYRHPVGEVCIEIPGGCVDDCDKDFEAAIKRELLEETGYTFDSYQYLGKISPNTSTNTNFLHMFLAIGGVKTGKQQLDENEEIEVFQVSIDELKKLLQERKLLQSMHVTCIMYALERLGEEGSPENTF